MSTVSAVIAPLTLALLAGAAAGFADAGSAAIENGAFSAGLFGYTTSLGALLAFVAALPIVLGTAVIGRPRTIGGRVALVAAALAVAPPALGLARGLYKRIPWGAGDAALAIGGAAALVVSMLAVAWALGRVLARHERSVGRALLVLSVPALLLALPAGSRVVRALGGAADGSRGGAGANLLLLTVDTLRPDCLGVTGDPRARTPHLDRIARVSVVHTNCLAPSPWTLPSLATVLTGVYPGEHDVLLEMSGLSADVTTIAQVARENGRRTAAFVSNPWLATGNLARGFDTFDVAEKLESLSETSSTRLYTVLAKSALRLLRLDAAERLVSRGIEWIDGGNGAWFLWLHLFDPHLPNWPAPPYDRLYGPPPVHVGSSLTFDRIRAGDFPGGEEGRREIERLYRGEVAITDREIGRLWRHLEAEDLLATTAVVFSADHGEEFWDHDDYGHGHSMFDEVVRVPLWVRRPGASDAGIDPSLVRLVDLAPTALAAVDLVPRPGTFRGRDLLASGRVPAVSYGEAVLYGDEQKFLRTDRWKLVLQGEAESANVRLYDLLTDPGEHTDLAPHRKALAGSLTTELFGWIDRVGSHGPVRPDLSGDLDPATRERLESMGYLGR